MIELSGLTPKQVVFADLLWSCQTQVEVDAVVSTFGRECALVRDLMLQACIDEAVAEMPHFPEVVDLLVDIRGY
jgi:hypothetical protein